LTWHSYPYGVWIRKWGVSGPPGIDPVVGHFGLKRKLLLVLEKVAHLCKTCFGSGVGAGAFYAEGAAVVALGVSAGAFACPAPVMGKPGRTTGRMTSPREIFLPLIFLLLDEGTFFTEIAFLNNVESLLYFA
jgi:hypothetical protein